jgi:tetratricopeptide (TPR) repeat protein
MHKSFFRFMLAALWFVSLYACAGGGPVTERQPKDIRNSIRYQNKGVDQYTKGCYRLALERFMESHERFCATDDLEGEAYSLNSIANTYHLLGDIDSALLVYDDALEIYDIISDSKGLTRVLTGKASALIDTGRLDDAGAVLDQADNRAKGVLAPLRLLTRARLAMARQETEKARTLLTSALQRSGGEDDPVVRSGIYYAMAHLQLETGDPNLADTSLKKALSIDRQEGAYHNIAKDLELLGLCQVRLGNQRQAVTYFKRSVKIFALLQDSQRTRDVVKQLEQVAAAAKVDIQATLHWIDQWLAGKTESHFCR